MSLNGHIEQRIASMEVLVQAREPSAEERERLARTESLALELAETMDPEHVKLVCDTAQALRRYEPATRGGLALWETFERFVLDRLNGETYFRFALPPPVAQIMVDHQRGLFQRCAHCLLLLPYDPGYMMGTTVVPETQYFEACPLCGCMEIEYSPNSFASARSR